MARKLSSIYGQTLKSSSDAPGISTSKNLVIGSDRITHAVSATDFPLQVSGGVYVSGSAGIGTTNPTSKLHVVGDVRVSGVITATTFSGALTGTASNVTTNANLTGHVTSVGNAAVLGSFTSLQLLTALTDETGSGANVFATSPTLVTPALGTPSSGNLANCTFPTLNQNTSGNAATATNATTANVLNTSNSYQVTSLGIGQAAGSGTELDLNGRYAQTPIAVANLDIDCSLGNYYTKTISSNSTFTFSNIPASRSYSFTLCVTHDSGTITWPGSVKWPKNISPTLNTNKKHKFMFSTYDGGSVFYGAALVDFTY